MLLNHYEVLSVDPSADLETIRHAWRVKVRLLHPDRHRDTAGDVQAEAAREILLVNRAWDTLRDPDRRRAYDAQIGVTQISVRREPEARAERGRARTARLSPRAAHDIAVFLVVVVALCLVVIGGVLLAGLTK